MVSRTRASANAGPEQCWWRPKRTRAASGIKREHMCVQVGWLEAPRVAWLQRLARATQSQQGASQQRRRVACLPPHTGATARRCAQPRRVTSACVQMHRGLRRAQYQLCAAEVSASRWEMRASGAVNCMGDAA